jgi:hypothetical protein
VDRVDDLGGVDALQVHGGDAEVGVAELALDHDKRDAFVCRFNRMCVAELVRCEPEAHSGKLRGSSQLLASG